MGFCHPYPYTNGITDKGENKIRCMRVLLNCSGFLKPAIIITEKGLFSECQNPLFSIFIADLSHFGNLAVADVQKTV